MIYAAEIRLHQDRFTKLRLVAPREGSSFRFGGHSPKGVLPCRLTQFTSFLLTVPFENQLSCSIFINLTSLDPANPHFVFTAAGEIHDETSPLIETCWHAPVAGSDTAAFPVLFPPLDFETVDGGVDPPSVEGDLPDSDACFDHHKLGGYPYHYQRGDSVAHAQNLINDGFHHHLQLAFPGPEDAEIDRDWPFGEYVFHLFARPFGKRWELRFVWS